MSTRKSRNISFSTLTAAAIVATLTVTHPVFATSAQAHGRHHHHHYGRHVVEAPFTRVESGHRHRTSVWAPFTRVHVSRRGTYVRAPFVDLFVPR